MPQQRRDLHLPPAPEPSSAASDARLSRSVPAKKSRGAEHDHVTTEQLLAAGALTRDTLYRWVACRLLARPRIVHGDGGQFAAWPTHALERVRLIVKLAGHGFSLAEILTVVQERWPSS